MAGGPPERAVTRAIRDPFGRLLTDPAQLPRHELVQLLKELAGRLQAHERREERWLGSALADWLLEGGDLARLLGVAAPRGSHHTPQALARPLARHRR